MTKEEKHNRFLRIASVRTERVLEALMALGNCANPATYLYDVQELAPIFSAIEAELASTKARMEAKSPYRQAPFRLLGAGYQAEEVPEHE